MSEKPSVREDQHALTVRARSSVEVSGVLEVESFDEESVALLTSCGAMTVEGKELRVGTWDTERGLLKLEGQVHAIVYSEPARERRRFWRL